MLFDAQVLSHLSHTIGDRPKGIQGSRTGEESWFVHAAETSRRAETQIKNSRYPSVTVSNEGWCGVMGGSPIFDQRGARKK